MPPGFGGPGGPWPRPPGGSPPRPPSRLGLPPGEEPPSKRQAGEGAANGGGPYGSGLAPAPSWDVESQFAAGSYVSAAGGGGGNLSPDIGRSGGQTYSPEAGGGAQAAGQQPGRPLSAAYSAAEPGELPMAGNGGMHMSPMSDDDAPAAAPAAQQPLPAAQQAAEEQGWQAEGEQEAWDAPDAAFAAYVADMVRRRVGKYAQLEHPLCISQDEAAQVCLAEWGILWQQGLCGTFAGTARMCGTNRWAMPAALKSCQQAVLLSGTCFFVHLSSTPTFGVRSFASASGQLSTCFCSLLRCSCTPRSGAKSLPRSRRRTRGGRLRACSSPSSAQSWRRVELRYFKVTIASWCICCDGGRRRACSSPASAPSWR